MRQFEYHHAYTFELTYKVGTSAKKHSDSPIDLARRINHSIDRVDLKQKASEDLTFKVGVTVLSRETLRNIELERLAEDLQTNL